MPAAKKISEETEQAIRDLLRYDDGKLIWKYGVCRAKKGQRVGWTCTNSGYRKFGIDGTILSEHRVVYWLHHGKWPAIVDHVNRRRDDNTIENLREVDQRENMNNRRDSRNGVVYRKAGDGYEANVRIGFFEDKFEAHCAVQSAKAKLGL